MAIFKRSQWSHLSKPSFLVSMLVFRGVYGGYIPLTFDPNFQRDIQAWGRGWEVYASKPPCLKPEISFATHPFWMLFAIHSLSYHAVTPKKTSQIKVITW